MGTHPIFESDFDCLTDRILKMNEDIRDDLISGSGGVEPDILTNNENEVPSGANLHGANASTVENEREIIQLLKKEIQKLTICQSCNNKEKKTKALQPCGHTVCQNCALEKFEGRNMVRGLGYYETPICPFCYDNVTSVADCIIAI